MVALPVRDLLGHLLRGEVPLVAVAVDDELVAALAVELLDELVAKLVCVADFGSR
ncbi:hypothetical protein ACF073_38440 [Streptomyces sp. NPDC015171]|uniref:hypothetical protein n=1 Tax=Streptomyces sp. NPDC015171 TaxID=3364945 RepID=UPI0036FF5F7E